MIQNKEQSTDSTSGSKDTAEEKTDISEGLPVRIVLPSHLTPKNIKFLPKYKKFF